MRKLLFASLALTTLLTAGCGGNRSDVDTNVSEEISENTSGKMVAAHEDRYAIRAGTVTDARANALSGNFQLQKAGVATGIPSEGLGGACLIFAAADLGYTNMAAKQCQTNSDCSTPNESEYGYCDGKTKTCWAKPANDDLLCIRGKVWTANTINAVPEQPVDVSQYGIKPGAKVRVAACLNKSGFVPGPAPDGTGCAGTGVDTAFDLGPIATVK